MGPNMNFTPVSTTMQCTINLTLQYMVIYTALGLCRTVLDLQGEEHDKSKVQKALKQASMTVFYAPMVCLMFVGYRMRVLQLSKGAGDPQDWARFAMQSVAYSILANTLLVLVVPVFTKDHADLPVDAHGDVDENVKPDFSLPMLATIFTVIRYLSFLGLYVGFGVVCAGVFMYEPAAGIWEGEIPALSPAVACTMTLATTFFFVYFLQAAAKTWSQLTNGSRNTQFEEVMESAANTLGMAPMLCVLFLGARMRALQMDPVDGNPQSWAQNCFYASTYALIFQTILAVSIPLINGGEKKTSEIEGDATYELKGYDKDSYTAKVLSVCRWIIMVGVYVAGAAVVCSVFTIEHPDGKEHTPPISPTMQCVINLAFQYFFIYLLLWVFYTVEQLGGKNEYMTSAKQAIESAKCTVHFAPMLSVLFIATRMRALQITKNQGAPQGWVQDGMYLATWSVLIQFMMCLILPIFTHRTYTPDTLDGDAPASAEEKKEREESRKIGNPYGAYVVVFIRYAALLALIGGVTTVITGVFLMTPETANGRGSIPLITDGTLPVDLAPPPPGINDVPGAKGAMEATGETVGAGVDVAGAGADAVTSPVADVAGAGADAVVG